MSKEWFANWFDTTYYHILYSNRNDDEAQQFINNLFTNLDLPISSKILDVACGKGRHAKFMHAQGMHVTGIDLSCNSIAAANTFADENLTFDVWDMRIPYKENDFDVVTNLFSSFGYFDNPTDDDRAIQAMQTVLKNDGLLIFDYMNPEFIIKSLKGREIVSRGDLQFHIQRKVENGFICKQINFLHEGQEHEYTERLKVIKFEQFQKMFLGLNFKVVETFGNYDLSPFAFGSSPRQIWILKKQTPHCS
jgi:SAM-dependent methyltransferase